MRTRQRPVGPPPLFTETERHETASLRALERWAVIHGRRWRSALLKAWANAKYPSTTPVDDVEALTWLRDEERFGPKWLKYFQLPQ